MNESEYPAAVQTLINWYKDCDAPTGICQSNLNTNTIINTGLFFMGSVDCLCISLKYDDKSFMFIAGAFFEKIGFDDELYKQLILNFNNLTSKEPTKSIVLQGGQAFQKWVNKDYSATTVYLSLKANWDNE